LRALGNGQLDLESREVATENAAIRVGLINRECRRPFGARSLWTVRTQGSQSLALGLTLIAAPQLGLDHFATPISSDEIN